MPGFVPEMTEQGTVQLMHRQPCSLSRYVIGLRGPYRDKSLFMSRHSRNDRPIFQNIVFEEIKNEAALRIFGAIWMRQIPTQQ